VRRDARARPISSRTRAGAADPPRRGRSDPARARWCCSGSVRRSGRRGGTSAPPTCGGVGCAGDARSLSAAVRAAPFSRTGSRTAACLGSGGTSRGRARRPCRARVGTDAGRRQRRELSGRRLRSHPRGRRRAQRSARAAGRKRRRRVVPVRARAAELAPDLGAAYGTPAYGSGSGYDGPLACRMGNATASGGRRGLSLLVRGGNDLRPKRTV
jgi:hypothetical protein